MLKAWAAVAERFATWEVWLVGPGSNEYRDLLIRLVEDQQIPRVHFEEAQYGEAKAATYAGADLFILPSFSENFGMTVAEALAHACPVIATNGAPWKGLTEHGCGWWVDPTIDGLARAMSEAMSLDRGQLRAMGSSGRRWMEASYDWPKLAREMARVYHWILGVGPQPESVRVE
jgi:glycosyltransferase involved in cell wall biosynthesis